MLTAVSVCANSREYLCLQQCVFVLTAVYTVLNLKTENKTVHYSDLDSRHYRLSKTLQVYYLSTNHI